MSTQQALPALSITQLPEEFFIDLAVGVNPFVDICDNYNIDQQTALTLENDPVFQRRLRIAKQVVEDDGTAFRSRCRVAVSNSVHHVVHMLNDSDVPASTQLEAFKTLVKYGDLEPATKDSTANMPSLVLNIVAPDGSTHDVIESVATVSKNSPQPPTTTHTTSREQKERRVDPDQTEYATTKPTLNIVPPAAASLFGAD